MPQEISIPGYQVKEEIGRGGMATVYLALQESLNRQVAIKVMNLALVVDETFQRRFLNEGRTVAQLTHPHIVTIYDIGNAGPYYYFSMELLGGGNLSDRIKKGLSSDEALAIAEALGRALGYAHRSGFVHRDIKPHNVLFRNDGTPILTDFGIAKAMTAAAPMTAVGYTLGSAGYMSPEQSLGKPLDSSSDLYSLGVLLWEMLTGTVPYDAEDAYALALKHATAPLPRLPAELSVYQPLIDKLLAKRPEDRFANAEAFLGSLRELRPSGDGTAFGEETVVRDWSAEQTQVSPALRVEPGPPGRPSRDSTDPDVEQTVVGGLTPDPEQTVVGGIVVPDSEQTRIGTTSDSELTILGDVERTRTGANPPDLEQTRIGNDIVADGEQTVSGDPGYRLGGTRPEVEATVLTSEPPDIERPRKSSSQTLWGWLGAAALLAVVVAGIWMVNPFDITGAERRADEARLQAELEAQLQAELEAQRQAELEAQRQAELEAQRRAELEAQRRAELEAQRQAELEARQSASEPTVDELLALADRQWQQQNRLAPADDNAFDTYRRVIALEPSNTVARERLLAIGRLSAAEKLRRSAQALLAAGELEKGLNRVNIGLKLAPEDPALSELQTELQSRLEAARR